jgi:hypothetical protein
MRGTIITAALVTLALGGTPTAALVLGSDTPTAHTNTSAHAKAAAGDAASGKRTQSPQPGPPAWADGDGRAKQGDKHADQAKGWANGRAKNAAGAGKARNGMNKANKANNGQGHGAAVRAWAHCVADYQRDHPNQPGDAAAGDATGGTNAAVAACGKKPAGPGQAKAKPKPE